MKMHGLCRFLTIQICLALAWLVPAKAQEKVDVALVLAVDVSRSMSYEELRIQRQGYAAAIASPEVLRAIGQGVYGRIGVTFFEWAGNSHFAQIIDWTIIETAADAKAVAAKLLEGSSVGARRTSISGAIEAGAYLIDEVPFQAERHVIDISGDGPNNQGLPVTEARDMAVAKGIIINGLPLMTRGGFGSQYNIDDLDEYYRRCVIGGPGSFVLPVNDWPQFPEAVRRKLVLEIGNYAAEPKLWRAQITFSKPYDCLIGEKIRQQRQWQFDDFDR
ncbi:DUF1194 domain-containing protein [Roseibium sp.]|uniref:DUF1194 domain-containing protein n=1 Tax=Roseibium sp. TaxID=1936156 RepID=UPI003A975A5E